ncbi:MAG TPA: fatty acid desaturase [Chthoniobacterales bacterium]
MNDVTSADPVEQERGPHWISRAAFQVVSILFFSTEAVLGLAVYHGWIWLAVPLVMVASHFMHGFLIGFHEASHSLLRKNRLFNDIEGNAIGVFSLMSFTLYRVVHQTHHAHLSSERDEEMWPFAHPRIPRWVRCTAAILELTVGLVYTPMIFLRAFLRKNSPVRSSRVRRRIWWELALSAVVWIAIIWAVAHWRMWSYFLWLYLAPAFIAANLQSWRKYIEHVGLTGDTVNGLTRSIVADTWPGRLVAITLLHEPFHGVHHQRAGLPHAELPQRVADLMPMAPGEREPFSSYRHALLDLLRGLGNPRAGSQWREL